MSLAIAEALVSGASWTPQLLADHFVEAFRRDPHQGYARGFQTFLDEVADGPEFLARIRPDSDKKGWMSVRAAITAFSRNGSLKALLIDCVGFTGDVDTVATIAMVAASSSREYARDLPSNLLLTLENGPFGRDYLVGLDARLMALKG